MTFVDPTIAVGSVASANAIPSVIDAWFSTNVEARVVLEHQDGEPKGVLLTSEAGDHDMRAFARLAIARTRREAQPLQSHPRPYRRRNRPTTPAKTRIPAAARPSITSTPKTTSPDLRAARSPETRARSSETRA